jgi:hypothetical protein
MMPATDQLDRSLHVPTPQELKALRIAKGLSLVYVSERIALHPRTLREIEDGTLHAAPSILTEWGRIILDAPDMRSRRRFNLLAAAVIAALAFVIGCTVLMHGGR